jgi:hypothetical protein
MLTSINDNLCHGKGRWSVNRPTPGATARIGGVQKIPAVLRAACAPIRRRCLPTRASGGCVALGIDGCHGGPVMGLA